MNAHDTTAHDLARALTGAPNTVQSVHVCSTLYSGSVFGPRHVVLVIPDGQETGDYYECSDRTLALLRTGMSPEDLELDRLSDELIDSSTYWEG